MMSKRLLSICAYGNSLVLVGLAIYFFFAPLAIMVLDIRDPALQTGQIPAFAFRWHRHMSERFETWARDRVTSQQASTLSISDISGTEWPVFSAVYYLWATEALQASWEQDPSRSTLAPNVYAAGAIEAAVALVADPNHATWVKKHWGEDYLHQENVFYRMLLIGGMTSYQKLTEDLLYQDLLVDQVSSLSQDLDASPHGLLDDYPNQCYPIDILPAIAVIQRSQLLPQDTQARFVARSYRGFAGARLDPDTGLPAYIADSRSGFGYGPARGVGIAYMLIWAPELWPSVAQDWYSRFETHFWQEGPILTGVREFSKQGAWPDWLIDVDAGPVVDGYGTAASAFGIGAARVNGRLDHAYPLSVEALVATWPLPDGTLVGPRLLSNLSNAPFVGESALLFTFTRTPVTSNLVSPDQVGMPLFVYLFLLLYGGCGCVLLAVAYLRANRWQRITSQRTKYPAAQLIAWSVLLIIGLVLLAQGSTLFGLMALGFIQVFPVKLQFR